MSPDLCDFDKTEVWFCKIMSTQKETMGKGEIKICVGIVS